MYPQKDVKSLPGFRIGAVTALLLVAAGAPSPQGEPARRRNFAMGFTLIPHDVTPEGIQGTLNFIRDHADLLTFNLTDQGVPWKEALADEPFPGGMEEGWHERRRWVPAGFKVFVFLTPLDGEKKGLAAPPAEPGQSPRGDAGWALRPFDHPEVARAYARFCGRAVRILRPDFVSIAHECTRLLHHKPGSWEAFARLCKFVRGELRKEFPSLPVGVTHSLPLLWNQQIARAVQPTVRDLDFLGLSFFPHAGIEAELHGGRALPQGRDQWLAPLRWARRFSERPIALCDTAYATREVLLLPSNLRLKGSPELQKSYVTDLLALAQADGYLFANWQIPIDVDRLALAVPREMQDFFQLFQYNGLATGDLRPKPALEVWDRELRRNPRPE